MNSRRVWDIKTALGEVIGKFPDISEAYVFGSRAYGTNSLRSDFDLLLLVDRPLQQADILELHKSWPILDFWETFDRHVARSLINGSSIVSRDKPLIERLEAKPLWKKGHGFLENGGWAQESTLDAQFDPSIAGMPDLDAYQRAIKIAHDIAARNLRPAFFFGYRWHEIAIQVVDMVERALARRDHLSKEGKRLGPLSLQLATEYDLQNLMQICLAGVVRDLEAEPFEIKICGQRKFADLAFSGGRFIIEAKRITDASSRAAIIKSLPGLAAFYQENPHVEFLLFLILVLDKEADAGIEARFSDTAPVPRYLTRLVKLKGD